jgi:ubiquitin C-terminal hydrolase
LTLEDCFEFHGQREKLSEGNEWYCENCEDLVLADKKVDIWSVLEVMVVHLRRFQSSGGFGLDKMNTFVDYPDRINMKTFIGGPQKEEHQWYRLYAVSNHYGWIGGGHDTANAIVQDPFKPSDPTAPWYGFDDLYPSPSEKVPPTVGGCVLFYEKED